MVQTACEKAVDLLKSALVKLFSDLAERVKTVENRLACIELKCHLSKCVATDPMEGCR